MATEAKKGLPKINTTAVVLLLSTVALAWCMWGPGGPMTKEAQIQAQATIQFIRANPSGTPTSLYPTFTPLPATRTSLALNATRTPRSPTPAATQIATRVAPSATVFFSPTSAALKKDKEDRGFDWGSAGAMCLMGGGGLLAFAFFLRKKIFQSAQSYSLTYLESDVLDGQIEEIISEHTLRVDDADGAMHQISFINKDKMWERIRDVFRERNRLKEKK